LDVKHPRGQRSKFHAADRYDGERRLVTDCELAAARNVEMANPPHIKATQPF
jgi:hypothetical protein